MERLNDVIATLEELMRPNNECMGCPCRAYQMERDALELLREYRDRMLCKPDDVVYYIHGDRVVAGTICEITIYEAGDGFIQVDFKEDDLKRLDCDLALWNVVLFPTREAAEAKLMEDNEIGSETE